MNSVRESPFRFHQKPSSQPAKTGDEWDGPFSITGFRVELKKKSEVRPCPTLEWLDSLKPDPSKS